MNRTILALVVTLSCALTALAQGTGSRASGQASGEIAAAANKSGKSLEIVSGTRLAGELQSTVDVRRAKVGDQVVLKTTRAIKSGGHTVVGKGAKLIGHVTEVTQKSKGSGDSSIGLVFDRLEQGSLTFPITATISSITRTSTNASSGDDDLFANDSATSSHASTRSSVNSGNGSSLLGGVTSTTGAVLSTTTTAAGNAVGSTTSAAGSTIGATTSGVNESAAAVGRSLGRIQISESSNTSVAGGAVLSLRGENLRLEKGTNFNLVLKQSASAGAAQQQ